MPIVLGLGNRDFELQDPLGLYSNGSTGLGGKSPPIRDARPASADTVAKPAERAAAATAPKAPDINDADWNDLVDTVIAEAGGEGPEGMTAVAHVIKNRADRRDQSLGDVVRAPHQFTGYAAPGPVSQRDQLDAGMRSQAETILRGVLAGEVPDPTGGADHYHANSVSPGWASRLQPTTTVGNHLFYTSGAAPAAQLAAGGPIPERRPPGNPNAVGLARLMPPEPEPTEKGKGGRLAFVHKGQDQLQDGFSKILVGASQAMGRDFVINSGFRPASHPVEARKKRPGEHSRGWAADISMKGMSSDQRAQLVSELMSRGVKRFGTYSSSPDMLHVDMKDQTGGGKPWFMHDRTNRRMSKAPEWFRRAANGDVPKPTDIAQPSAVVVDETFKSADPMGLYAGGESPFAAAMQAKMQPADQPPAEMAQADPLDAMWQQLDADEPGRYKVIDEAALADWREKWQAEQPSQFMKGLKGALIDQNPEMLGNAMDALGVLTDADSFRELGSTIREWSAKGSYKRLPRVGSVADIRTDSFSNFVGDATDYAAYSLGSGLGTMAPSVAVGTATATVTANPVVGMVAGAAGPSYVQNLGDVYGSLRDNENIQSRIARGEVSEKQIAGWAAAAAVPMAAIDTFGLGKIVGSAGGQVKRGIVRRIAKGIATGALVEGSTEAMQEIISQSVQEALGAEKSRSEQAISVLDNAIGGMLAGGAVGGATGAIRRGGDTAAGEDPAADPEFDEGDVADQQHGEADLPAAGAVAAEPTDPAIPTREPAKKSGPLARAVEHGQRQSPATAEMVVSDPAVADMGPGALDGQRVRLAQSQENVPAGMRRIVLNDGSERVIGERLLLQADTGGIETQPLAEPDAGASSQQPISSDQNAEAPAGAPGVGTTVRVDAPGMPPFMATVDSYADGEAVLFDSSNGEVLQVPLDVITPIAPATSAPTPQARADEIEDLPPSTPVAGETKTEMPARDEQAPAMDRFPGPPRPGQRVIVDADGIDRFSARVESYEEGASEALVRRDDGTALQVPVDDLYVSKLTPKEVEAEELKRNPPVPRERSTAPTARDVRGKQIVMPDDTHAALFDLGKLRRDSKATLGRGQLDLDAVSPAEQRRLAEALGVSDRSLGQIADDYRYRVERAAKEARSNTPIKMNPVSPKLLDRMKADDRRADARAAAETDPVSAPTELAGHEHAAAESDVAAGQSQAEKPMSEDRPTETTVEDDGSGWWDSDLTPAGRREVLTQAGVKRSDKTLWRNLPEPIRQKLRAARQAAPVDTDAHAAATSPSNNLPEPTSAQKEAGNYKLGHVKLGGLDISVENPAGSQRSGVDASGQAWSVTMKSHYGYFKGTIGRDKDHIDTFVRPGVAELSDSAPAFVVDQVDPGTGRFDEHKVMIGFQAESEAQAAYLENYDKGWKGLGNITETTVGELKAWFSDGDTTRPFSSEGRTPVRASDTNATVDIELTREGPWDFNDTWPAPDPEALRRLSNEGRGPFDHGGRPEEVAFSIGESINELLSETAVVRNAERLIASALAGDAKPPKKSMSVGQWIAALEREQKAAARNIREIHGSYADVFGKPAADAMVAHAEALHAAERKTDKRPTKVHSTRSDSAPTEKNAGSSDPVEYHRAVRAEADRRWPPRTETTGKGRSQQTNRYVVPAYIAFTNGAQGYDVLAAMPINVKPADVAEAYLAGVEWEKAHRPSKKPAPPTRTARTEGKSKPQQVERKPIEKATGPSTSEKIDDLFAKNKLFTADKVEAARARLKAKMGQINSGIDPEVLVDGMTIAGAYIEAGVRNFADYAKQMTADFGPGIKPYLLSFWEGARNYPGLDTRDMTPIAEAAQAHAELNSELPASEARALGSEAAAPRERTKKTGKAADRTLVEDWGVEHIDGYTAEGEEVKSAFLKDATAYLRAVADVLQSEGFIPHDDAKGRSVKPVNRNEGGIAVSGEVSLSLRHPESDAVIYAHVGSTSLRGVVPTTASGVSIMYRAATPPTDRYATMAPNRWAPVGLSAADLGAMMLREAESRTRPVDLKRPAQEVKDAQPAELGERSASALEGTPAGQVRGAEEGRSARQQPAGSRQPDLFGAPATGGRGTDAGRGMADGAGGVSVPALGERQQRDRRRADDPPDGAGDARRQPRNEDRVEYPNSAATPAAKQAVDYSISDADELGAGGQKAKFRNNLAAIKLLRSLDAERRPANRDEQAVLAKWVGWGGLRAAFRREDGSVAKGWEKEAAELRDILTPEELRAAEASTRNAHFTSPEVVRAIWDIAQRLGFKGGQVLEPSVGAGNFLGLMPGEARTASRVTGVELDNITGGIARHLYPHANIQAPVGFQDLTVPDGHFDLVIGNPPFGSEKLYDKERRHLNKFSIHNFFFAKSVDALRPNGVLAMVVTNYFMDAADGRARSYIADRAELVGAIRLPNNAFLKNAGTEVTTDIIVLRRRAEGEPHDGRSWAEVGQYRDKEGRNVPLNNYFIANPEMMLGEYGAYGTMYRGDEAALVARPGDDLAQLLQQSIRKLPENLMPAPGSAVSEAVVAPVSSVKDAIVGSMLLSEDGNVLVRVPDHLGQPKAEPVEFPNEKAKDRVAGMIRIRDTFARLRRAQIDEGAADRQIDELRKRLNSHYDSFVKQHGPVNADANRRLFRDDPTWPQISALEEKFDKGVSATVAKNTGEERRPPSAVKAPIFTRRTQQPYRRPTSAASAKDALATVLADRGRVDLDDMARLYRQPTEAIVAELGPLLFRAPSGAYETADAYLSGNVKAKLAEAERAAEQDPAFRRNVSALRDVIPADIEAVDIDVKAGAPWVPSEHIAAFSDHITGGRGSRAIYSKASAKWVLDTSRPSEAADTQWSTDRTTVARVVEAAVNGQTISIYDRHSDGSSELNRPATEAANDKVERVKAEWRRWLWTDDARREQLVRLYNDTFNTDVLRVYDGSHLTFPGKVSDDVIELRPHQKNFVWRALQSSTALADHVVGAGKTFAVIASVMEMRRIGQARKPMLVVPNHLVGQWAADFIKLYPGAKILAATKKDFEAENRKRLFARVATGDWDAVVVAHSSFGKVPVDPVFEQRFIEEQIGEIELSEKELRDADGKKSRSVSELAKRRETLQSKLKRLLDAGAKDLGMTFEEMGIDALVVDEAHEFKNLGFATSMTRVAGLGNTTGSQKAADLYMKIQSVKERTGGRNVIFATGTPLSNSMAEMFTVQRYLDGEALRNMGIAHFDAWARVFGEVVTDWELSPSGQYKLNTRFAKFVNMPELMQRYLHFADVITNDDIKAMLAALGKKLPLPKVKGGKPQNVVVERSSDQADYIGEGRTDENGALVFPEGSLVWRAEHLPKKVEKGSDNMLKVMSDARKAALDMRLIDPAYGDVAGSKVHIAADHMKRIYSAWTHKRGTQLVFIDLSTPKKARAKEEARLRDLIKRAEAGEEAAQEALDRMSPDEFMALDGEFSVYDDLRQKLIDRGIPEAEIAFIHDANTDLQKEELFGKVRSGRVRFLFGSTPKMGAGTNVQNRLVALHHLDAPWRPSDLEQRDGRGIRQGNELYAEDPEGFEIEILRYATKNTLDARQWQTIEGKARFIQQVRKGGLKQREIEDIAGEAANAAEMKAAASGNPLILEEMDLRQKLRKLESQGIEHGREQYRIRDRLRRMSEERKSLDERMPIAEADAASARRFAGDAFSVEILGETIDKPKEAGAAIVAEGRRMLVDERATSNIGSYGPFKITMENDHGESFTVTISGRQDYHVHIVDITDADPVGTAMRLSNTIRKLIDEPALMTERTAEIAKQIPALERQVSDWNGQAEFDDVQRRHREVLAALQPKKNEAQASTASQDDTGAGRRNSDRPAVASLTGTELEVTFRGPEDMPALRRAAQQWYRANLIGSTATTRDGLVVGFRNRGLKKSTFGGKGDTLLRSVPAIRAIIEHGEVVYREPGNRQGVAERVVLQANIDLAGEVHSLAVSIHRGPDGSWHYDLHYDRASEGPGVRSGGPAAKLSRKSALEGALGDLNIFEWPASIKDGASGAGEHSSLLSETALRSELLSSAIGPVVAKLIDAGVIRIAPAAGEAATTQAFTEPDGSIHLVADRISRGKAQSVLLHEAFHAGAKPLLGQANWTRLMFRLDSLFHQFEESRGKAKVFFDAARDRVARAEGIHGEMPRALRVEEFGAYAIEEHASAPRTLRIWVEETLGTVKVWMLQRFGRQVGDVSTGQLKAMAVAALRDIARGDAPKPGNRTAGDRKYSTGGALRTVSEGRILDEVRGRLTDMQPHLLAAVPFNYFAELKQPNMTAVDDYLKVKRQMDAYRGKKHAAMDEIAQEWLKYARLGKEKAAALARLMHEATLAGVDPAKVDDETAAKPAYDALRKRFLALPKSGREVYVKVRNAYRAQADELDQVLVDNVRKSQLIAQRRAEIRYKKQLEKIAAAGLSKDARKQAEEDAARAYSAENTKAQWSMKARITKLRQAFESSRVDEPYFPLARFGRYFVSVRDVDGSIISFSRRERAAERDRLAKDMKSAYPTARVETGVMEEAADIRSAMDPRIVAEVEQIIGGAGIDASTMTSVLDQIWQRYLETMPDLSTRKRFIHRKGTAGFDADALRAFSHHMFHATHQTGRLKFGLELQELVNETTDQAREADEPTAAMTLANELKKRHKWVMNPVGGSVAQTMTSAAFVWYLAATPAAALVNMSQTPMLGIPVLGARFGGVTKAAAALMKASIDTVSGRGSLADAKLPADEKQAMEAFYDSGLIDRTQAHDIAGVGETGVEYSPVRARVMAVISWMFHRAEVWNREVTALAAYRLARGAGQDQGTAIDTAHDLTWKTHFDYSNASRPRLMQNDFAKVALVFRAHNVNMLYRVFRDVHQALKGESSQARREARYQLAGVVGMQALFAGAKGVIGFNLAMALLGMFFGDEDDPFDFEQRISKDVIDLLGPELGGVVLNGAPGHYLGISLTDRIGMPDLWFRSPYRDLQGKEEFDYWVMNSLGASVSMLGDLWRGVSLVREGNVARGAEVIAPKWATDLMKGYRYLNEGVTSLRGDQVLDPSALGAWDIIAQSIGFTPAKVAETYERNSALINADSRIKRRRGELLNRFALAHRLGDEGARSDALDAIRRFNAVPMHRPVAITAETLRSSLKTRIRNAKKREDGVLIQNPRLGRDLREQLPEPIYR